MHCILLYHTGNVRFLVLHTGTATGIRIASFLTSWSRRIRVEITPFKPDQRSYLRREAPSVLHCLLTVPLLSRGGTNTKLLILYLFLPHLDKIGV